VPTIETVQSAPDGRVLGVNPRRLLELPYFLLTNQPLNEVTMAANQSSSPVVMSANADGPIQIVSFAHQKTGAALTFLQIQDGQNLRGLMNGAVHIDTLFGSGQQPYRLPEALYLDASRALVTSFIDISGSSNAVRFAANAQRFTSCKVHKGIEAIQKRLAERKYISVPYWYTLDNGPVTLAASATSNQTITIAQDHHFQLYQLSAVSTGAFNIDIIDAIRGESMIDAPQGTSYGVSSNLIFGSANFPFKFHERRLFQAGQKILITLTDRTGAPNTVYLTFGGCALASRLWR